jgi:hypothetical protein
MHRFCLSSAFALFCLIPVFASAQDGFFPDWFSRVDRTKNEQPHWLTPVATTTPRLEEEYRYDQLWQVNGAGVTTNNYDSGKGLELIPFEKVEVIFNVPPYLAHNDSLVKDGWGEVASHQVSPAIAKRRARQLHPHGVSGLELAHGTVQERSSAPRDHSHHCLR